MILYFSATGNSAYVAKRIAKEIQDETLNLFEKIRGRDFEGLYSEKPWVIVAPTYAWRIPRILEGWVANTKLEGNRDIYFVMTCGGNIGNAAAYLKQLCAAKEMSFSGCFSVVMPENYIALFTTPSEEEARGIIQNAENTIDEAARMIKNREKHVCNPVTLMDKMSSGIVNQIFYPMFVHAKKFYTTDACVSCGKCQRLCPLKNIRMEKGKPVWGDDCTHCMACICRCPSQAIEYGKHSKGQSRYTCPKTV